MARNKAGIEIFKGFDIDYPEYEVITPQSVKSYTVRSMKVIDEENLKGSMVTPAKVARHLAETIWSCLVKKPDEIKTFEDFITNTTMKDRDALLFGLYVATYKDIQKYSVTCSNAQCGFTNQIKIDVSKWFTAKTWLERDKGDQKFTSVLDYKPSIPLKIFKGVNVVLRSPTIKDEITISESNQFSTDQMTQQQMTLAMIDKFTVDPSEKKPNGDSIEERDNILTAYNQLPSPDRKVIEEAYDKEFGQYQIEIKSKMKCSRCGEERDVDVDIASQFFRALYE